MGNSLSPAGAIPYQYIVLHRSCVNHVGVAAAQAAHAAAESIRVAPVSDRAHVCVLAADTSAELENLAARLAAAGIHHALIKEPDPPYFGAAVALGVEPQERSTVQPFMVGLPVFRSPLPKAPPSGGADEKPAGGAMPAQLGEGATGR